MKPGDYSSGSVGESSFGFWISVRVCPKPPAPTFHCHNLTKRKLNNLGFILYACVRARTHRQREQERASISSNTEMVMQWVSPNFTLIHYYQHSTQIQFICPNIQNCLFKDYNRTKTNKMEHNPKKIKMKLEKCNNLFGNPS